MAFPPVRTFIVHRSNWYSRTASVSLVSGTLFSSEYPLSNLLDGLTGPVTRFATTSVRLTVTLVGTQNTNILGLLNHNLDPDLLIQPYVNGVALDRTFSVAYPNCWIDLRGFDDPLATGIAASSVGFSVSGNSRPIAISEVVVAGAYLFNGTIEPPLNYSFDFKTVRRRTEYGALLEAGSGVVGRQMPLNLRVNLTELGYLQSIWDDVGEHGEFVPVVPTTRVNDIWCVRWPATRAMTYPLDGQYVKVPLTLIEEPGGVLV